MKLVPFKESVIELEIGKVYRRVSNGKGTLRYVEEKDITKNDGTIKKKVKLMKGGYLYRVLGKIEAK